MINHILNNQEGYKVAVIVNDIGEVNIDADLIQRGGVVTEKDESLVFYADVTKYVQNLLGKDLVVSAQVFLGERVELEKLSKETQDKVRKIVREIADKVEKYFKEKSELEVSNFDSWLEITFVNGKLA